MVVILLLVGVCFALIPSVFARNYTASTMGPEAYSDKTTTSDVLELTTTSYGYVRGDRTHFFITSEEGWLRDGVCVGDDSRTGTIKLYEDDVYPNADDLVKTYTLSFKGRSGTPAIPWSRYEFIERVYRRLLLAFSSAFSKSSLLMPLSSAAIVINSLS